MEIQRTRQGVVHDITIVGKLDYASSPDFDKALREMAAEKPSHLVAIDMAEVTGLSSPSLRALLSCAKRIRKDEGVLVLTRPSDVAREALTISGFLEFGLFTIEEDREAAMVRLRAMADASGLKVEEPVEEEPAAAPAAAPAARANPLLGGGGGGGAAKPAAAKPEAAKPQASSPPSNPLLAGAAAAKPAAAKPAAAAAPAKPAAPAPAKPNPLLAGGGAAKPAAAASTAASQSPPAGAAPSAAEEEEPYTLWEQIKDVFAYYLPKKK